MFKYLKTIVPLVFSIALVGIFIGGISALSEDSLQNFKGYIFLGMITSSVVIVIIGLFLYAFAELCDDTNQIKKMLQQEKQGKTVSKADKILNLKKLRDQNLTSQQEYDEMKAKIIGSAN